MKTNATLLVLSAIVAAAMAASPLSASAQTPGFDELGCGWYVILGCSKNRTDARRIFTELGGAMAGGGAGLQVLNTSEVDGFRPGFYCVADGPYITGDDASSVAWIEAVPDAYVKLGC